MCKILVTDGRSLAALAVVRSLGKRGHTVHTGETFKHNLTSYSKYVNKSTEYPCPEQESELFIDSLYNLCNEEQYDIIIPVRDQTTIQLSKNKDVFDGITNLFLEEYKKISQLMDKGETIKIAQKHNVPIPNTWFPERTDITKIKKQVDYPVLVRPRRSSGARGIQYVEDQDGFLEAFSTVSEDYGTPIIQEYIKHSGGHYSLGTIFNSDSEEVATHVYKETKQYPRNGGPAVNAVSVSPPEWTSDILRILKAVNWVGPAHMDVLYDPESNEPKLLEVNPRLWMSIQASISSGIEFPNLILKLGMNNEVHPPERYDTELVYRWFLPNEILWFLNSNEKLQDGRELLSFNKKKECYGIMSTNDIMPIFGTAIQSAQWMLDSEKRQIIFNRGW